MVRHPCTQTCTYTWKINRQEVVLLCIGCRRGKQHDKWWLCYISCINPELRVFLQAEHWGRAATNRQRQACSQMERQAGWHTEIWKLIYNRNRQVNWETDTVHKQTAKKRSRETTREQSLCDSEDFTQIKFISRMCFWTGIKRPAEPQDVYVF